MFNVVLLVVLGCWGPNSLTWHLSILFSYFFVLNVLMMAIFFHAGSLLIMVVANASLMVHCLLELLISVREWL